MKSPRLMPAAALLIAVIGMARAADTLDIHFIDVEGVRRRFL